jgi:hypothetical protein
MYPILVWYIKKMATDGGGGRVGGVTATIANAILVPGSNPQNLDTYFLANLATFYVASILAISTYINLIYDFRTVHSSPQNLACGALNRPVYVFRFML